MNTLRSRGGEEGIYWKNPRIFTCGLIFGSAPPLQSACTGRLRYFQHREKKDCVVRAKLGQGLEQNKATTNSVQSSSNLCHGSAKLEATVLWIRIRRIRHYLFRSGSFQHQAKKVRKTLISNVL